MKNFQKIPLVNSKLVDLKNLPSSEGKKIIIENNIDVPFVIKRIFYLYDIPGSEKRGEHAHLHCHQFLVAIGGSFEVTLDNGKLKKIIKLDHPRNGLYIPPGIWASEKNFSVGAICLVFASHGYDESDYIRNYNDFKAE